MKRLMIAFALMMLVAAGARAQDAIDLTQAAVMRSPADVASWPATVQITALTMSPGDAQGLSFTAEVPERWDFHVPGWGTGTGCPNDGCVLYTVWAVAKVDGSWRTAAFLQMWRGKTWTGAPILSGYRNWWGDGGSATAGVFGNYVPKAGDPMGFFLTAGNARAGSEWGALHERSNVVLVNLPAGDSGEFTFGPAPTPTPTPTPTPVPVPVPTPQPDPQPILTRLAALEATVEQLRGELAALGARLAVIEAKPVPTSCRASVFGIGVSCQLSY